MLSTYDVSNQALLPHVVRDLRQGGYRAWVESVDEWSRDVLITDAPQLTINLAAGNGLWAKLSACGTQF